MADINKFLRSKDKLMEVLTHLTRKPVKDEKTVRNITVLERSIKTIELKIEEFKKRMSFHNLPSGYRKIRKLF